MRGVAPYRHNNYFINNNHHHRWTSIYWDLARSSLLGNTCNYNTIFISCWSNIYRFTTHIIWGTIIYNVFFKPQYIKTDFSNQRQVFFIEWNFRYMKPLNGWVRPLDEVVLMRPLKAQYSSPLRGKGGGHQAPMGMVKLTLTLKWGGSETDFFS